MKNKIISKGANIVISSVVFSKALLNETWFPTDLSSKPSQYCPSIIVSTKPYEVTIRDLGLSSISLYSISFWEIMSPTSPNKAPVMPLS